MSHLLCPKMMLFCRLVLLLPSQDPFGECGVQDRKSTRLNSSHDQISYAVFCLKKKKNKRETIPPRPNRRLRTCAAREVECQRPGTQLALKGRKRTPLPPTEQQAALAGGRLTSQ